MRVKPKVVAPFLLAIFLIMISGLLIWVASPVAAAPAASSCANPDITGSFIEADTTWSNEVYVDTNLTVRANSTLTIMPGTRVIFCDDYDISIGGLFSPAAIIAVGTAAEPITFEPDTGVPNWGILYFGDSLPDISILQYVDFVSGGGDGSGTTATVQISNRHAVVTQTSPIIDQVSIQDSVGYGLNIDTDSDNDPTPAAISNLTITNSGQSPIYTTGSGVSALNGPLTLTNNLTQTIVVKEFAMYFDQLWRDHGIPYHIQGELRMRSEDPTQSYSTWHIDPGVDILMDPLASLTIDADGRISWIGTEDKPITIKQVDESGDPWGQVFMSASEDPPQKIAYAELINGGGAANSSATATINQPFGGTIELDYVTVMGSQNAAFHHSNWIHPTGGYVINQSHFEGNRIGIMHTSGTGTVRNTAFINNFEAGIENSDPNRYCVDAAGNYWGDASGPADAATSGGQCEDAGETNAGTGDSVTDGVAYFPWLTGNDTGVITDQSNFSVDGKLWIVANGVDSAPVELTVRDANGTPLAGKEIEFRTTRGRFSIVSGTTNANGVITTQLTSTETGSVAVTAFNVTDNMPVAAKLSLYFWQGGSDTGGLVSQSGTPYASPELIVEGEPFEAGLPVFFKLPMRNTQASAVQVDVTYSVQNFGIASGPQPVSSPSALLQPNESWDAPGGFTPVNTAHQCVLYEIAFSTQDGQQLFATSGTTNGQKNLKNPKPPCEEPDATKLVPGKPGGLGPVFKHFKNLGDQTNKVIKCLQSQLGFGGTSLLVSEFYTNDYSDPVTLQSFTPPTYAGEVGDSQALIDSMNRLAQYGADIAALNLAIADARTQTNRAAQANAWQDSADRLAQVREFEAARVTKLQAFAAEIDTVIGLLDQEVLDETFTSDDYAFYLNDLKANGFDADTIAFHKSTGLSDSEIASMLEVTIEALESDPLPTSQTLRSILLGLKADLEADASGQASFLAIGAVAGGHVIGPAQVQDQTLIGLGTIEETFEVGNPGTVTDTVDLVVRTGDMPPQWSYSLDRDAIELGPGEVTTVTLTVDTGLLPVLADETFYFGVEGFIDEEYIGGVMFEQRIPVNPAADSLAGTIYLPFVTR